MRHLYLPILFSILFATSLQAQIGIRAGYHANNAPDWVIDGDITATDLLSNGYSFGIDYWIPMKAYRVDFFPELNYSRFNENEFTEAQWASFFLNTHFYFLDFEGDCDCPTFSKSGGAFQKGLFFQLSPGITYQNAKLKDLENSEMEGQWAFSLAAGLGLDIGVSDFLTITPMVSYRYFLPSEWEALEVYESDEPLFPRVRSRESAVNQIYAGIRLGFRFDQRY